MHFERAKFQKKLNMCILTFLAAFSLVQTTEGRTNFTALLEPIKVGVKRVKICKSNLVAKGHWFGFQETDSWICINVIL